MLPIVSLTTVIQASEFLNAGLVLCVKLFSAGFLPGFEKWASKMQNRACSNEQFIRQHMKNKTIFFKKWPSTGLLDAHQHMPDFYLEFPI